jgi:hypothetical protein
MLEEVENRDLAVYLIRYLNVPPARLPALGDDRLKSMPSKIEEIRSALLDAFDRQHQIDAAANLVVRHLTLGHPPDLIISALAHALLREDAGFHAFQMFDAGVRQFGEWGNTEPGRHILVAVARYLAAHSPTERGWLQTADIASVIKRRPASCGRAAGASMTRCFDGGRDGAFHRTEKPQKKFLPPKIRLYPGMGRALR